MINSGNNAKANENEYSRQDLTGDGGTPNADNEHKAKVNATGSPVSYFYTLDMAWLSKPLICQMIWS